MNEFFREATRFVSEGERYLVVSHVDPDGDAIGSTLAVGHLLRLLGKRAVMVNASPVPAKYRGLPGAEEIARPQDLFDEPPFERVIAVDVADEDRMGDCRTLIAPDARLLNIDHHRTNDRFGTHHLINPEAAATAEVLYDWIESMGVKWSKPLAACVYTGLLTDTGGFRYSNTTPAVMKRAARLLECGVDAHRIAEQVLETLTIGQLNLLRRALSTLRLSEDGRIAWMWLTYQDFVDAGAGEGDLDGIVNYARNVDGAEVGILFRQLKGGAVKVSLRSRRRVDVSEVAGCFGGGGHARAAGCTVAGSRDEVERRVLERVVEALGR